MLCVCLPVLASLFGSVLWYVPLTSRSSSWFNSRVEVKFMSSERDQSRSWGLPGAAERKAKSGNRWTLPWPLTLCRRFEPWKGQTGPSSRNLPTATERDTDTDSDSAVRRQRTHSREEKQQHSRPVWGQCVDGGRPTTLAAIATAAVTGSSNTLTTH